jgi:DNA (cytosine-5)-methyltransferase 1
VPIANRAFGAVCPLTSYPLIVNRFTARGVKLSHVNLWFKSITSFFSIFSVVCTITAAYGEAWPSHLVRLRKLSKCARAKDPAYRVLSRAINAADYGAAQKRHRAIFIGIASDYGDGWTFPEPTHSQEALTWSKHIERDYWDRHGVRRICEPASESEAQALKRLLMGGKKPRKKAWLTVRDVISDLPMPTKREQIAGHWQHPGARTYPNHTGSCMDEPAKALKAGDHGVPGGENMLLNNRNNVRYFTIREMARLQGFPDEFIIGGSWKAATRQLGNAVTR